MTDTFTTIEQALSLLIDAGDKPLQHVSRAIKPRPSDVLKAWRTQRSQALFVHDDVDGEEEMLELLPTTESAEDAALTEDYTELHGALRELTPKQQTVIDLLYWQGLNLREVSARLDCTYENARLHHSKALKTLRDAYA